MCDADTYMRVANPPESLVAVATGVVLELGIAVLTGRREAWDSGLYWTLGLPLTGMASVAIGYFARGRDWLWTCLVAPSQVMTMMVRSGELGGLWPLAVVLSSILSAPFVIAAFIGSRFRKEADPKRL